MTLTHILPSLRRTIADPLVRDHWPAFTVTTPSDVTIAGLSLARLVDWCGTPCIHTGDAVIPGSNGRPSETRLASVVVVRVTAVEVVDGQMTAWIDGELSGCVPLMEDARMIGRVSTAHDAEALVFCATPHSSVHRGARLPLDTAAGDLIAIPCVGATTLHAIRGGAGTADAESADDAAAHDSQIRGLRCGK